MTEQDIFLAALEIENPAQRADYLARACAGDSALRRQVEGLLAAHARSGPFLDVPVLRQMAGDAAGIETGSPEQAPPAAIDLSFLQPSARPGSLGRLGHYEIQEIIGRGGYGIVLKAFDDVLHRVVAIKVMTPEMAATSPARKRFLREARAAAAIRHDNVVSIHAVEDEPLPFLVMEYIAGPTLQQRLDDTGPLDVPEVVKIGQQVASGLAAAHAMGLVHRDIKPANIILERGTGRIKLTDFGLARTSDDASLTQSGGITGTPLYMSPEQAQGGAIDPRSDLFSLGSVLYALVSGRPPFRAANPLAVMKRVVEDRPRPIQEIIPEVPDWLVAIIARLHAKDPADRFASALEVADLLAGCLSQLQQRGRVEIPVVDPASVGTAQTLAASPLPVPAQAFATHGHQLRPHRRWIAAAAMMIALLAGLGMTEATGVTNFRGTVVRLFSPDGTLVVEVDDPAVSISIDGADVVITGAGVKEIRLKPGQHKLLASKDGKLLHQELVTVARDGRQVIRVSKEAGPATEVSPAAAGTPTAEQRKSLEWVLSIGGIVEVNEGGQLRQLNRAAGDRLPREPFKVSGIAFGGSEVDDSSIEALRSVPPISDYLGITNYMADEGLSDIGLEKLAGYPALRDIASLTVRCPKVTDRGLAHLRFPKLRSLDLWAAQVTDAGLVHLRETPNLTYLNFNAERTTAAGIATVVASCPKLTSLQLGGEWVTDDVCEPLTRLRKLRELVFCFGARITEVGIRRLRDLPELTTLRFTYGPLTDADLAGLKDLPALRNFEANSGPSLTDQGLIHLGQCSGLTSIVLRGQKVTKSGIETLAAALPHCRIDWDGGVIEPAPADADRDAAEWVLSLGGFGQLVIGEKTHMFSSIKELPAGSFRVNGISLTWNGKVTDAGLEHLEGLTRLNGLALQKTQVTDAGLVHLKGLTTLNILDLSGARQVRDTGLAHLAGLTNLHTLGLSGTQVSDAGLIHLKKLTNLGNLNLGDTQITDAGLRHLKALHNLDALSLYENGQFSDAGLEHLKELTRLRYLDLHDTRIGDAGLAHVKELTGLMSLHLAGTRVTDAGLAHLKDLTRLTTLQLAGTRVTDAGLEHLKNLVTLADLNLGFTPLDDVGLGNLKALPNLQSINLNGTKVSDAGLEHLTPLTKLAELWLQKTRVTDAGLDHVKGLANLRTLRLQDTNVTRAGVETLATALPGCRIEWDGGVLEPTDTPATAEIPNN